MAGAPMTPTWHAEQTPDSPAIIMGGSGETTTYAQLEDRSTRLARVLRACGLGVGDHIAIMMENNRPFLEVAWAAQRSGLYYTAINAHLRPAEVQYVLDDCRAVACSWPIRPSRGPRSRPSCSTIAGASWPRTSARGAWTSRMSSPGIRTESCTSACCASATGRVTTPWSSEAGHRIWLRPRAVTAAR